MDLHKTAGLISQARKEKGLTQKELAERLHISDRTVSKWERAAGFPDVGLLDPLADALELPVGCLLSGEREPAQDDQSLRRAIRVVYAQCRRKTRRNIGAIAVSALLTVFFAFLLFAILNRSGAFLKPVAIEVPAVIYEDGAAVGETTVTIDGTVQTVGRRCFWGRFALDCAAVTGQAEVSADIAWDVWEEGYQQIRYNRPGITWVDAGVEKRLYISPDMGQFALTLSDGRIVATNEPLAQLQAIKSNRYALDYGLKGDVYPYFSYRDS